MPTPNLVAAARSQHHESAGCCSAEAADTTSDAWAEEAEQPAGQWAEQETLWMEGPASGLCREAHQSADRWAEEDTPWLEASASGPFGKALVAGLGGVVHSLIQEHERLVWLREQQLQQEMVAGLQPCEEEATDYCEDLPMELVENGGSSEFFPLVGSKWGLQLKENGENLHLEPNCTAAYKASCPLLEEEPTVVRFAASSVQDASTQTEDATLEPDIKHIPSSLSSGSAAHGHKGVRLTGGLPRGVSASDAWAKTQSASFVDGEEVARPPTKSAEPMVRRLLLQSERSGGSTKDKEKDKEARATPFGAGWAASTSPIAARLMKDSKVGSAISFAQSPNMRRLRRAALLMEQLISFAVIVDTVMLGVSAELEDWPGWLMVDIIFAAVFLLGLLLNIYFLGVRDIFCGRDKLWGWLEVVLVLHAWAEVLLSYFSNVLNQIVGLSFLRIVRLLRITRIIRIMRFQFFGDLLMMIRGTMGGFRTLLWSSVLLCFPVYIVAFIMKETIGRSATPGDGGQMFVSLGLSFFTVFRCIIAGDCSQEDGRPIFVLIQKDHGSGYIILYMVVSIFMTFGLFNVIVAIYVENTVAAAKYNEIYQKRTRLRNQEVLVEKAGELVRIVWDIYSTSEQCDGEVLASLPGEPSIQDILNKADVIFISQAFLEEIRDDQRFQDLMHEMDIADEDQLDLFDTLDVDGNGQIDLNELLLGIPQLRGDARRADLVAVRLVLRHVQRGLRGLMAKVDVQSKAIKDLHRSHSKSALPAVLPAVLE